MGASPARRQCRSMRARSLVAPNATQKARPENLVVAATAIAEASPFPRQLYQNAARMSRGAEGTTEASGRRDQAGLAARKRRVGAVRGAVPAQNEPKSDRPRAKTPMNRRKSRLRRRAAPIQDRVPTRFVSKYTARAQLKPLGCSRAGLRARETGGGGRPARFCQEQTLVLAEQFGSTEHDGFRVPYLSENTPEAPFHGQAGRLCSRTFAARP